ncbi:MAG: nucleotidyltransferase [Bacillota bacterium]|nr:nucleotidyltransferase [Bacillota bacterium]
MKTVGLVVEYNPFHNGHLYHLQQAKKISDADSVVCVMSGNFIQRGEPALINKWARTKAALLSGADLVLELPVVFAMSSAEYFAFGAVKILDSLGIVDSICFGSEIGRLEELKLLADILVNEPEDYKAYLKNNLSLGVSYPAARENALAGYLKDKHPSFENISGVIASSNNILGIEYLKALLKLKSRIEPVTIQRIGSSYNDENISGELSSATAIRKLAADNSSSSYDSLDNLIPPSALQILKDEFANGRGPVLPSAYENLIIHQIRKMTVNDIKAFPGVTEGLENRIKSCAENCGTFDELVAEICTRRYTRTRIQRCLFDILIGITSERLDTFMQNGGPQYIRVLGFNNKGRRLLSEAKEKASLPLIVKTADLKNSSNPLIRSMLELESLSTDIYVLGYKNGEYRKAGQEFTQNIVRI